MTTPPLGQADFGSLGIAPKLLDILSKHNFQKPTPIQEKTIPIAITGKDLMGIAQTGTGKTLAFGIPMIQQLSQNKDHKGLIILPTRELAIQVSDSLKKIGSSLGLKTAILIGGEPAGKQIRALNMDPHIVIATPGRLIDMLESNHIKLTKVKILVLDEADRMLDMGFAPQIKKILQQVPKERQTMLFSATMPDEIMNIANSYMALPLRVEVAPAGTAAKLVSQEVFIVHKADKSKLLGTILQQYHGSVLVFSRTKFGAKKITQIIRNNGISATEIHSNKSLNQRLEALQGFKLGKYRVMVATDIAARGIDVTGIQLVINYDLPDNPDDYVHRIGRTGRAGTTGHAISFAMPEQQRDIRTIERLIKKTLPVTKPAIAKSEFTADDKSRILESTDKSSSVDRRRGSANRKPSYGSASYQGQSRGFSGRSQSRNNDRTSRSDSRGESRTSQGTSRNTGQRDSRSKRFGTDEPRKPQWPRYKPNA